MHENHAEENLHPAVGAKALRYFRSRKIRWHDGKGAAPSNHLCCAQSCCVNFWFPFVHAPAHVHGKRAVQGYADGNAPSGSGQFTSPNNMRIRLRGDCPRPGLREMSHGTLVADDGDTSTPDGHLDKMEIGKYTYVLSLVHRLSLT